MNNAFASLGACLLLTACGGETRVETSPSDCQPWRPRAGAWTSLATARPPVLGSPAPSADGKLVYAIGSWLEKGVNTEGLLRSSDLGITWCMLPKMPEPPMQVTPSTGKVLYASSLPADPNVESAAQDVMKSTDGGVTWNVTTAPSTAVNTLIVSRQNADVVWSLSSDPVPRISVSQDGVDTWSEVALPPALAAALEELPAMANVVVDPASPERALFMAHIYPAQDGSRPAMDRYLATDDAGATWRESTVPPVPDWLPTFTAVVDAASSIFLQLEKTLLASMDWGQTWESTGEVPAEHASLRDLNAGVAGRLFATAYESTGNGVELWQSNDGGTSWDQVTTPGSFQPWFELAPRAGTIVGQAGSSVVVTHDEGAHWQSGSAVPVADDIVGSQVSPFPIWVPSQGVRSEDGGVTWKPFSMPGLGRVVPTSAGAREALWIADDKTELERTEDGGSTWKSISLDRHLTQIHGVATCAPPHPCVYVVYDNTSSSFATQIKRSDDGGRTWGAAVPAPDRFFIYPDALKVAPDDDRHIVGSGGDGLAESKDGGKTWTSQAIDAGSVALLGGGVMLVSDTGRNLPQVTHRSDDGGVTWTQIEPFIGSLFTSPQRPGEVYLIADTIYRSKDKGETWVVVEPKAGPVGVVALADAPGGRLFAGVELAGLVSME